jgi:hypothetical protein
MKNYIPRIILITMMLMAMLHPKLAAAALTKGMGVLDSFVITSTSNEMEFTAAGWVGTEKPEATVKSIIIELGENTIYNGKFERVERPDVSITTGQKTWLHSGWRITGSIPNSVKSGDYKPNVRAKVDDGTSIDLAVDNPKLKILNINKPSVYHYEKNIFLLISILITILLYMTFRHDENISRIISEKVGFIVTPVAIVVSLVLAAFVVMVSLGITGSSVRLLYQPLPFIEAATDHIAFSEQPIRSDEWLVFTSLAIGQKNQQPPFPIVNKGLGFDGQNNLVIGMTGVPINHVAAFAKPATWGFHLFDLKRALAWYWWFPIISCFLALWWLFDFLLPGQWRLGASLSLLFCLSPYTIAWSNWPAYVVMFPTVALCSTLQILREGNRFRLVGLAVMLGLSVAGFILVLYPAWQIPLGYLYIAVAIALLVRDRGLLDIDFSRITAFTFAILLASIIMLMWWFDARPAIEVILNTVYPGRRQMLTGGGLSFSDVLRGFSNIGSLYKIDGGFSNHSEIASFYYLYVPLFLALGFRLESQVNCEILRYLCCYLQCFH